jgi:nanoRNase/pAp phosphatase (c-di-AMP/oligoRNAs hydrolase)
MRKPIERLFEAVGDANRVLILPHNDPDPDAIASALALRHLLSEKLGVAGHIACAGIIGRAENKALVRYLKNPLQRLKPSDFDQSVPIALIDTQPGTGNNDLPSHFTATIVIDHHPRREATATAAFADIRQNVGATSTILTGYLQAADLEPPPPLATALFYGIKTDTMGLGRAASKADTSAYFYLQPRIDVEALVEIERAQVPPDYFRSFVTALQAVRLYDGVVISFMGQMDYPDLTAEMADLLLRLEGALWVICMGTSENDLILSVRTRSRRGGAGQLVQHMVSGRGSAGGHGVMAAGQVPLGEKEDPGKLARQLIRRALQFLKVPLETQGQALV